jgi:glycosyltransferase involved in cell wall biosynthesis
MTGVTVLIPCKDEARNIRACVESARSIADEVLVADSGSTDATLAIVEELGGCRVITREFVGYADFKNWAIPQASHPWILLLDADERVSRELAAEIGALRRGPLPDVDGFRIPRRNYFMGRAIRYSHWGRDNIVRLFRRDICRFADRPVHEAIECQPQRTGQLQAELLHFTGWSYDDYLRKAMTYSRLWAVDAHRRGRRVSAMDLLLTPHLRFVSQYLFRGGFLDGLAGLQVCVLNAYFGTFLKRARLWELERVPDRTEPAPASPRKRASTAGQQRTVNAA